MISGRNIVCFASGYDAPPTSKHHVAHLLAEDNRVLWVNYHASRAPQANVADASRILRKIRQVFTGLEHPRPNLWVLTPLVVPLPASPIVRRTNRMLLVRQVKKALSMLPPAQIHVWSFTPDIAYALGHFGEERVLYYCVDDFACFSGYDRNQVLKDEAQLCLRSHLVVTTSLALQEAKAKLNPNTMLVPHGVDFDHFSRAVNEALDEPPELAAIPRPRLGFFGLIRDWVNVDLVAKVAQRRPEWQFVFIGDSTIDLSPFADLANMRFVGQRPYAQLPAWCRHLDAGLIPFRINELTRAVNPIKLREYLAAGLPVISTPLPEVMRYQPMVSIADDPASFEAAIEKCLRLPASCKLSRMKAMADETWPSKVRAIRQALDQSSLQTPHENANKRESDITRAGCA